MWRSSTTASIEELLTQVSVDPSGSFSNIEIPIPVGLLSVTTELELILSSKSINESNFLQFFALEIFRRYVILVYVIVWVAVVFGINCASNAGRKFVIVRGAAEHYYCFLPALR